ncbi:MAG: hypothetical protein QOI86_2442, partial [Actinomycetota bacterium]|nr:hypothetical protein [Actinomycetota bacterium]
TYTYDPETLAVISVTDPNGHTQINSWDANGNVTSTTDVLGRTTVNTFDALNDVTSTTDPNGVTTTMVYDANGNLLSRSTPLSGTNQTQTTTFTHGDTSHPGDVTAVTDPDGKVWTSTYDTDGNTVTAADPLGNVTRSCYNAIGRPTATITPRGSAAGVTCSTSAPAPFTTYVGYNPYGQPLTVTDPLGHVTTKTYDADGNLATATDPDGNQTAYSDDAGDEPVTTTRADQTVTHAAYDPDGNLTSQTDAAGHATTYAFGDPALAHLPTTATDPNGRITSYGYDRAGNLITKTDPGGTCSGATPAGCTTMAYDPSGEIIARNYSDGTTPNVNIAYDADGQRTSMVDGTGTSTWVYDSLGRLTTQTNGAGQTVGYGYDLRSNLTSINYPGTIGTVTRTFDDAGRLWKIRDWANHETVFSYNADSFMTSQTYPNGTTATHTPDGADRLMAISHAPTATPGLPFASFTYGRDNANRLTSVTSTGVPADNHTYAYTALNQLQKADNQNTWGYDAADNPTALSGGTVQAFDAANQLCGTATTAGTSCASSPSGATTYQYDNRGNRTAITTTGGTTTLTYNQANRLTGYGTGLSYAYDGDGLRTSKTISGTSTAFTWDLAEGLPLLLVDGTTNYIYGPNGLPLEQVSSGTVTYYHHDQLGSTRALTNSAGAVIATYTYDPYGKLTASTGTGTNPFGYAGQYTDQETGFQYLRARYYDPATGQFLVRDPLEATTRAPYSYVADDPLNGVDPTGEVHWLFGKRKLYYVNYDQAFALADTWRADADLIRAGAPVVEVLASLGGEIGSAIAQLGAEAAAGTLEHWADSLQETVSALTKKHGNGCRFRVSIGIGWDHWYWPLPTPKMTVEWRKTPSSKWRKKDT